MRGQAGMTVTLSLQRTGPTELFHVDEATAVRVRWEAR